MKNISEYIIESLLNALVEHEEREEMPKKELTGDEKLVRSKQENAKLYEILISAARYKTCLRNFENLIDTGRVFDENESVIKEMEEAWINEWLEEYKLYLVDGKSTSTGLADLQKDLLGKHSDLQHNSGSVTKRLDNLNDCRILYSELTECLKKPSADKQKIAKDFFKFNADLKLLNKNKDVSVPYQFIEEQTDKITSVVSKLNASRMKFEETFNKNFKLIAEQEKGELVAKETRLQDRDKEVDKEMEAQKATIASTARQISALDSPQRS